MTPQRKTGTKMVVLYGTVKSLEPESGCTEKNLRQGVVLPDGRGTKIRVVFEGDPPELEDKVAILVNLNSQTGWWPHTKEPL